MSTIFFPLRTSVELFEDRESPAAVTRAKEAAVLYDRLVFEAGLYDISITPNGSWGWWTPPHQLTPELRESSRQPVPVGAPMSVSMATQTGPGRPAEGPGHVVLQGPVSVQYIAEFHSGILDELDEFSPDWVEYVQLGGSDNPAPPGHQVNQAINSLNFQDLRANDLMPDDDDFVKSYVYKSFNRDSVIAADMGAAFNVTPLFSPMVARRGTSRDHAGGEALDIVVPNIGGLPWEAVVEYREHAGSQEARTKLREFEEKAASQEPDDAYAFLKQVSREISRGYEAAIKEMAPSLPDDLAKEALLTLISVSTFIGPVLEKVVSLGSTVAEAASFERSWIAALMKLRERG